MIPIDVVATLMALDSYTPIARPAEFGFSGKGPSSVQIEEQIASMLWHVGVQQAVDIWDNFCRSGASR